MTNELKKLVKSCNELAVLAPIYPELNKVTRSELVLKLEQELELLDHFLLDYQFETVALEVAFFKEEMISIVAALLYLKEAICIEIDKPIFEERVKKYYEKVVVRLQGTQKDHLKQFISYCATGCEEDAANYLRPVVIRTTKPLGNTFKNVSDTVFMYAKFKAIDQQFAEMKRLNTEADKIVPVSETQYRWLESKVDYVELVYLLANSKLFGPLPVSIKALNRTLGAVFGIYLEEREVYRMFTDIKRRKDPQSKVIQKLELSFLQICKKED